jgi:NitT/TauT family transport system substrate-binding protein
MRASLLAIGTLVLLSAIETAAAQTKPMKLTLNFAAAGPSAGFMMAKKLKLYEKAGIDLTIEEGRGSGTTAQMVATGQTDVGFADAPAAMQLRTKGAPVKIVAPILKTNSFAIISLEEKNIKSPQDLIGKKVAVQAGTAQTTLLDAILIANKIDKTKLDIINIDPGAFVGALLEKKVDAILGGADFHSIQIRERGFKINELLYRDIGVPTIGLSIVARDDRIKGDPELYRKFIQASLEGWEATRKDPDAAADAVVEVFPAVKKSQVLSQLGPVAALLCSNDAKNMGTVPGEKWDITYKLLTEYLGLSKDKPASDFYTADLVTASAPACP